jgi:hypothetical protein
MKLVKHPPSPGMVVVMAGLFLALGGVGIAATGDTLILGSAGNSATSKTVLTSPVNDRALQLNNTNTGRNATALGLTVAAGRPPLVVNSTAGTATNLSADRLDGRDSGSFLSSAAGSVATDSLANASVTAAKLSSSLVKRIDFKWTEAATSSVSASWSLGSLQLTVDCSANGIGLLDHNLDSTSEGSFNAVWIAYGTNQAANHSLSLQAGGYDVFRAKSTGGGTGSILFRLPSETVSGTFTFFANGSQCELYANLSRLN